MQYLQMIRYKTEYDNTSNEKPKMIRIQIKNRQEPEVLDSSKALPNYKEVEQVEFIIPKVKHSIRILKKIQTKNLVVDVLTKLINIDKFIWCRSSINLV